MFEQILIDNEIRKQYATVRDGIPDGNPVTMMHIGDENTTVTFGTGDVPSIQIILNLGSRKTSADYFHHTPPTPGEIESAINFVEDELTRAVEIIEKNSMLYTTDIEIRDIALLAGVSDQEEMNLSREDMERTFNRVAAVSLGRPSSFEGVPSDPIFAATFLILREIMFHLKFRVITVKTGIN